MRYFISIFLFVVFTSISYSQNTRLANQYYATGEYEKAAQIYKKLYNKSPKNSYYFDRYIASLTEMESFSEVEKLLQNKIRKDKKDLVVYVLLGRLYDRQGDEAKADKYFYKAIDNLKLAPNLIAKIGNQFIKDTRYKLALAAYQEGIKHIGKPNMYAYNIGDVYWRMGNIENAIKYFLLSMEATPKRVKSLKRFFQRNLDDEAFGKLVEALYESIQKKPDLTQYAELLQWTFVNKKQYDKALRQAKALDRRLAENGKRVYELGVTAFQAKDFDTAISAFEYIGEMKDKNSGYYLTAKKDLLNAKRSKIVENPNYTMEELDILVKEYDDFLKLYGKNNQTANILIEYAKLEAEFKNNHKKSISILNELIGLRNIKKTVLAEAKLALGDYYIIDGDVWEATLLYSQVDKAFKEADYGERARFKNAKLSYYNGDFKWAQEQFDFLKSATSKLISNDAIDLSVFITDNLGMDSIEAAMKMYSKADLLVFQHKYDEAQNVLDQLLRDFPDHSLHDDVLYTKAQIFKDKRMFEKAIEKYEEIVEKYPEEIRADNALFESANIYETYLDKPELAVSLYEKLFIDYSGSTFAVEARKRYRNLRGDSVQ